MKIFSTAPIHHFIPYPIKVAHVRAICQLFQEPTDSSYLDCFMTSLPEQTLNIVKKPNNVKTPRPGKVNKAKIRIAHSYKTHQLQDLPKDIEIKQVDAKILYKRMQAMRQIRNLIKEKNLDNFLGSNNGHEASAVALRSAMSYNDVLVSTKRSFGSVNQLDLLAELTANVVVPRRLRWVNGRIKRHINQLAFFGVNGNTPAQIPISNGLAFARKFQNQPGTVLSLYGDECINQGQLYETFQIASKWNLPCVFVYENDGKGLGSDKSFYKSSKNIPGICVDGSQLSAVYCAAKYALQYAQQRGPVLLEVRHKFCDNDENLTEKTTDPVKSFVQLCIENQLIAESDFILLDKSVNAEVKLLVEKLESNRSLSKRLDLANCYFVCLESKILDEDYFCHKYTKKLERSSCLCS